MKTMLKSISFASLAATVAAPVGFFLDALTLDQSKAVLLVCAAVWFAIAPFWMEHKVAG